MRKTTKKPSEVQDYRLSELERENETLAKQLYRMALRYEDIRQEVRQSREETRRGLDDLGDLLHSRSFWIIFTLLAGLFVLTILIVNLRMSL